MSQELERNYRANEPVWHRLEDEAKFILDAALRAASIKIHSLISRTKTLHSVREKASRKSYEDPLSSLDDLVGVRVVCLLRSDLPRIAAIVRRDFEVVSEDNKIDGDAIDAFGYQSVHFVVRLSSACAGPRYQDLHVQKFEVQLRTLAMDAWASLSHYLDYKNESDIPKELRKDFFALSGLFYVADTHFELFYSERQKSRQSAEQSVLTTPVEGQELNLDTLSAFLRKRYADRGHSPPNALSELLTELFDAGYTTLDKLHHALDRSTDAFAHYEKKYPPESKKGRFLDAGVVRISLGIADPAYAAKKYSSDMSFNSYREFLRD